MPISIPSGEDRQVLYGNFAFHLQFVPNEAGFAPAQGLSEEILGAFSDVSGLEATMEHKAVNQGGDNYGSRMLAGRVSFATVTLKRGIARSQSLWRWWSMFAGADMRDDAKPIRANRCDVLIGLIAPRGRSASDEEADTPPERRAVIGWKLENAMPVKFRVGDLSAKGGEIAIEELHLVHEGLHMVGVVS
ncbi:phage tail protein [Novosphingobium beihaiensis]|uniref:Phage tail protein n=1 Tax=Novosphingobium beihaiensis TaxID=2930389 RepID=A0ABT0BN69_9SPHN|nr:phage tail protein [Novosphingobium beihaiensis]MCJ2186491.1 phage tail protein [Novosphingobium beihaiensis]